ncbi:DoxX family protein [Leptospira idonii]|uniref:DoxX family protein n=1 Tax=Leptospira idonii TaxID=1193500 RepID=A0A4R9LZT0_9LEPT|nr:DoxX family protein [Leptospira idonii]TGN19151.1 DoxX family protein [Leptospira idonii]
MGQTTSKAYLWTGRVFSGLSIAFLLFDGIGKFFLSSMPPEALEAAAQLDYPMSIMPGLGTTLIICTLLYAFPRTSVLGAILLTGYLGGAVASHLRIGNPWASHILFPTYLGILIWGGLYLRFPEVRSLFPWKSNK